MFIMTSNIFLGGDFSNAYHFDQIHSDAEGRHRREHMVTAGHPYLPETSQKEIDYPADR